ncbi:phage tail sheath C-terminal domain-containing protein [Nostoc sp. 106C]|uniref:phage tail sheath family protein n=1 Tax=Nostoc sp. 106C TaxID=1932667 RepID=UPI000A3B7E47|nr:phage tail sheath C-terminal domain-containing protein [Nostoc sp. 106C]OUL35151.1 phage tail protein [Nostoc sp. 106C]
MPSTYKTPGVYIEEISKFPPSVAQVETAIPAFVGYTEKAVVRGIDYHKVAADAKAAADAAADPEKAADDTKKAAADAKKADDDAQKAAADAKKAADDAPTDAVKAKTADDAAKAANAAKKAADDAQKAADAAKKAADDAKADPDKAKAVAAAAKAVADAAKVPVPVRITSLLEYEQFFGTAVPETSITVKVTDTDVNAAITTPSPHILYYSLQAYFANGGGPCYIVSVGKAPSTIQKADLTAGLDAIEKEDEVTLIVFPESLSLVTGDLSQASAYADYAAVYDAALAQAAKLQDRFVVMDTLLDPSNASLTDAANAFRSHGIGINNLKYGAAYGPRLETIFNYFYEETGVNVTLPDNSTVTLDKLNPTTTPTTTNGQFYPLVKSAIDRLPVVLPAAPIVVGVYAAVDNSRGVWKAPANVSLNSVIQPTIKISNAEQEDLNVHTTGKSINAIRAFIGKGTLIWGARTLAGNDNEWRYVPVRRFFNMAEESIKKATEAFVFEPNDANTWVKVRAMIENFLILQWRAGALAGAKPEQAFYVRVGLNETMTALDILEGRMIIEIGMAVVRPAEFIILKFSHKMQES